jgi:hypothetical protein
MKRILIAFAITIGLSSNLSAGKKPIPTGAAVYIEEMDKDLDGFIRAEMISKNVPLKIVMKREEAHIVMMGTSEGNEKRSWHEGWLTTEKDHAVGNITVVDRRTGEMLWAAEAGDRSLWWGSLARGGQRKVASRLANDLKDAIDSKSSPAYPPPPPLSPEELQALRSTPAPDSTKSTNMSQPEKPMTNSDVIKLSEAGITEDLIISKIKSTAAAFTLDPDSLIALKKANISEKVISSMLEKQNN